MQHEILIEEIEAWLLEQALRDPAIVPLFDSLATRLRGAGIPLDRAALSWPTLHPLFQAEQIYWYRDQGAKLFQYPHRAELSETFLTSPFYHIITNDLSRLRRPLVGPGALLDFPVLQELHDEGYTDYFMTATNFRIARVESYQGGATGIMASWTTKRPGGFTGDDIIALSRIQKVFAVACHASIQMRVMEALGEAYLGPTAGRRVLSGLNRLGDGEVIKAVVWYSDLRGSTFLSSHMDPMAYLRYLKAYYACTAEPVIAEGGEVLDYIGDGVLAIFPLKGDIGGPDAVRAATRAMEQALACLDAYRAQEDAQEMQFSISLAMGEMMFGNIGVASRLSFSAIGEVVNAVTRIDDLTKTLGRSVLVTDEIAAVEPDRWVSLGHQFLPDLNRPVRIHARACHKDVFDDAALKARLHAQVAS